MRKRTSSTPPLPAMSNARFAPPKNDDEINQLQTILHQSVSCWCTQTLDKAISKLLVFQSAVGHNKLSQTGSHLCKQAGIHGYVIDPHTDQLSRNFLINWTSVQQQSPAINHGLIVNLDHLLKSRYLQCVRNGWWSLLCERDRMKLRKSLTVRCLSWTVQCLSWMRKWTTEIGLIYSIVICWVSCSLLLPLEY